MPASPGTTIWIGPDNGPFTVVGSANALPVTANAGTGNFTCVGPAGVGAPPGAAPVLVSGYDGTNVQYLRTDTSGRLALSPTSSVTALGGNTTSALSKFKKQGLAATVFAIKSSAAGNLYSLNVISIDTTANDTFIQLFDVATAGAVTLGTTVADWQFIIPKYAMGGLAPRFTFIWPNGFPFANGLQIASTITMDGASGSAASKVNAYGTFI